MRNGAPKREKGCGRISERYSHLGFRTDAAADSGRGGGQIIMGLVRALYIASFDTKTTEASNALLYNTQSAFLSLSLDFPSL